MSIFPIVNPVSMIRNCLKILSFTLIPFSVNAQQKVFDCLRNILLRTQKDTEKIKEGDGSEFIIQLIN